jgi:hypothetical protein
VRVTDAGSEVGGWAVRLAADGGVLWSRAYGAGVILSQVMQSTTDELIAVGTASTAGDCPNFHGATDVFLARIRVSDGELVLGTCIGGSNAETPTAAREVDVPEGRAVQVTGIVESSNSGDVGPLPSGGGGARDLMNAVYVTPADGGPARATVSCHGSRGPETGSGYLDDGSILGSTFGDNTGNFLDAGNDEPQFADLMTLRFRDGGVCASKTCAATARRFGGVNNESISAVFPGNVVFGETGSDDGGIACEGASVSRRRLWVGQWGVDRPTSYRCIQGDVQNSAPDDVVALQAGYAVVTDADESGEYAGLPLAGPGLETTGRSVVLVLDADRQTVTRKLRVRGGLVRALAARQDGCFLVSGATSSPRGVRVMAVR